MAHLITLEIVPSKKKYCSALHLNEEYFGELHYSIFSRKPSLLKSYDNLPAFQEKFNELAYKGAFQYAVRRLSLKSQPSSELQKALKDRHVSDEIAHKIIQKCQELGFLNDQQWYGEYAESLVRKKYGPKMILNKLRLKGLSQQEAAKLVSAMNETVDQKAQIQHLISTKFRKQDLSDRKSRQKVASALYRKGFTFDDICAVLKTEPQEEN